MKSRTFPLIALGSLLGLTLLFAHADGSPADEQLRDDNAANASSPAEPDVVRYRGSAGPDPRFVEATIDPADVVHFRHGINPHDLRKGLSPIHGVLREIFMDLEASNFVASLLRNMGVPGVVISPKSGATARSDDVEATKTWFQEQFGGDRRGGYCASAAVSGAADSLVDFFDGIPRSEVPRGGHAVCVAPVGQRVGAAVGLVVDDVIVLLTDQEALQR